MIQSGSQNRMTMPFLIGLAGLVLAIAVFTVLFQRESRLEQQILTAQARETLFHLSTRVNERTKALQRMAARWEVSGGMREEIWRADARGLLNDMPEVESIVWSDPRFVVRWVVDRQGRTKLVGLDNKARPKRHAQLLIVRSTGRPQSTGPRPLVYGGHGFVYDIPLSFPDGSSAGYLHASMRYPALLEGLDPEITASSGLRIAVNDMVVQAEEHQPATFDDGTFATVEAMILGENWIVTAYRRDQFAALNLMIVPGAVAGLILSLGLLAAAAIIFRARAFDRTRLHLSAHRRLQVAINALESPFSYFDEDDRLQNWNRAFVEMLGDISKQLKRGMKYEQVVRAVAEGGLVPDIKGQEEFYIQQRMATHALPSFTLETQHYQGNWIKTVEKRTSDGGTATLWIDITDEKKRQSDLERLNAELTYQHEELQRARERLKVEEERFRAFAEASADWFWESDTEHRVVWLSENFQGFGKYDRDWYIGRSRAGDIFEGHEDPEMVEHWRQLADREPYRDMVMRHFDGLKNRWIRSAGVPQFDENGTFTGYRGTGTDVTDLVEAEQRYTTLREQLTMAISAMSEGLVIFDPDDRMVLCNDKFKEHNPWSSAEIVDGVNYHDMLRMSADRGLPETWSKEQRETWFTERTTMRDRPGAFMEFETANGEWCRVAETRTANGGTVTIRSDITDLKHRQFDLETERNNAEAANRAKTDFLTNMSHELRTPLNAIIGFSDVMVSGVFGQLPDRYRGYATDISSSGNHLLSLINDLLDSAKVEAGSFELEPAEFRISEQVQQTLVLIQPQATNRNIAINVQQNREALTLNADERAVRQILLNLMSNAVKFSADGGQITVNVIASGDDLKVEVIDNGIGIAQHDLDRVFERFVQVQDPLRRSHAGSGIGLPLSRSLAEMHGGSLKLESIVGTGTTAILELPGVIVASGDTPAMKQAV